MIDRPAATFGATLYADGELGLLAWLLNVTRCKLHTQSRSVNIDSTQLHRWQRPAEPGGVRQRGFPWIPD